jgi:hypothetical protein
VNGYLRLCLTCPLLSACCCWRLYLCRSGVSLTLIWPCRLCLLRVLLCTSHCYKLSPFQAHWGRWHCTHFLRPACLFTVHMGSGSSPLSCGVFLPPPLLQAFLLLVAGHMLLLQPSPARLASLQFHEVFPSPTLRHSGRLTLFATCLLCCYCLLFSFSFFPGWLSVCPGGYSDLVRIVCGSTVYRLAHLVVRIFPICLGTAVWW